MKKKYASPKLKQRAYMERKRAEKEAAAEQANEDAQYRALNLCAFAETAYDTPAKTCVEEIQVHRAWLRALEEPDVQPGESLRGLARRTWSALLNSKGLGVTIGGRWVDGENGKQWVESFDLWYPLFSPSQQHFQIPLDVKRFPGGPLGVTIRGAANPDWIDDHWIPPKDCSGDEIISIEDLPNLPPIKTKKPEPK